MKLIDLKKVFDALDYDLPLGKMKHLGFTWKTRLVWFLLKKTKHCCKS